MEDLYHLHTVLAHVVVKLDLLEELLRDALKRIRGPLLEPIDGCAVDQAWEISDSAAEYITNWTEADAEMKLLLATLEEEGPELLGRSVGAAVLILSDGS